ncbi:GNAT family N-acetyltransferase [Spiroplasma endosymbiont of Diplazon laetatorius]|uniref:GNAT family N-acetyltransferase n=1 Tax=Spiroplasma endosymbiont of Diplazon laetatorius TaxID=3066322 RepID=UPI0030CBF891
MELKLIKPTIEYKEELIEMVVEFCQNDKPKDAIPGSSNINGYESIEQWLEFINKKDIDTVLVPFYQYLVVDGNNKAIGFLNIRLSLNDHLLNYGGHIGYSVLPKERQKGYAQTILKEALKICKDNSINEVLITCKEDNIYSEKVILKNGGVLEDIRNDGSFNFKRYWIK